VLPTLLDETAQRRTDAVLGLPFERILDLWADSGAWQARLAAEALAIARLGVRGPPEPSARVRAR